MRLLAVLLVLLAAAPAAAAPRLRVPHLAFDKVVLPNGLQVIFHVDRKLPLVHVNLWYHVGAKNEQRGKTGFAHLFEHMMLQGSKNEPEDFFTILGRAGARGGRDSNGTTDSDRTNYFSTAPSGSLEFMLWLHADLLATLADALTQAKLDNQRAVVRNERRQSYDNTPYGRADLLLAANLFPAGHPYSWPVIGSHEDLQAASLEDVKAFFRTYYTPNNLTLVVSGDFDPAEARRLVEKYFGSIPPGPALDRPRRWIPRLDGERVVEVNDRVPLERVFVAWPAPEIGAAGAPELKLAAAILGDGLSARLQRVLIHDRKLCNDIEVSADAQEIAGTFVVDATLRPGARMTEVEGVITAEIAHLAKDGPSPAEVERARTKLATRIATNLENIGAFGGTADILGYYNVYFGDPGRFGDDVGGLLAATPQSVRAAAATWLATPNRLVLRFHPEPSARPSVAEPDRSHQPALGADTPFHAPRVEADRLPNGLEIFVVERHDQPVVTAALVARAGSVMDPPGKEGLASLVAQTMASGTRTRSALALADAFGDLGATLRSAAGLELASHQVTVQKVNVGPALALLADVALHPAFPADELDRERKQQLDAIEQAEQDAAQLARRVRALYTFGLDHPYGRPSLGYRRSVAAIDAADVAAFHAAAWRPQAAALILAGDITMAEARTLAARELGAWTGTAAPPPTIPPPAPPARGKIVLVDRPDAAQTVLAHIYSAPAKKGDDYYAWRLASQVLCGGASGRLYRNLRQDKGYSYGMFSLATAYEAAMSWIAIGSVQTDKTKESVVEMVKELQGIGGARPITAQELEDARLGVIRNYAAGFGTNADLTFRVADLWARRWPMEELDRESRELAAATLAGVQAAGGRYAVPAAATLVLVGDRSKIEAPVRALGLGEVIVVDAEGRPLAARR